MSWKEIHKRLLPTIEQTLEEYATRFITEGVLRDAALHSLTAGGKRLRPFLALVVGELCGRSQKDMMPYAIALEFIHTYSLIHDDLPAMDDDDLRRGKPSCHKVFGEDVAILAGDALLTEAFTLLFEMPSGNVIKGGKYLSESAGGRGMVVGQTLDATLPEKSRNCETLDRINLYKTGKMIMAATAGAAAWAGADEPLFASLEQYGKMLGITFQITDDILDVTASEEELGKPIGSDADLHKITYASLLGLEKAQKQAEEFAKKAVQSLDNLPDSQWKTVLVELVEFVLKRRH